MNPRRLACRIVGHKWRHTLTYGDYREYACDRCQDRRGTNHGLDVGELFDWYSERAHAAAAGIMALLDATYAEETDETRPRSFPHPD